MTAGGESTKVQLTTGGKAVSSNRRPGSPADLRLNLEQCSRSMIPTARIARGSPRVPSHPVDISLAGQQFQALAVSPHTGASLHSFPRLTDERLFSLSLFFLGSSEDAHRRGLLQPCAALVPHKSSSFCFQQMTFQYDLKNQ